MPDPVPPVPTTAVVPGAAAPPPPQVVWASAVPNAPAEANAAVNKFFLKRFMARPFRSDRSAVARSTEAANSAPTLLDRTGMGPKDVADRPLEPLRRDAPTTLQVV